MDDLRGVGIIVRGLEQKNLALDYFESMGYEVMACSRNFGHGERQVVVGLADKGGYLQACSIGSIAYLQHNHGRVKILVNIEDVL